MLARLNTLPLDSVNPGLGNAGIAAKLGLVIFPLVGVLFVLGTQQQGHPRSLTELWQRHKDSARPPRSSGRNQSALRRRVSQMIHRLRRTSGFAFLPFED